MLLGFPADGYEARWTTWDRENGDVVTLAWENEAWTATGSVERENVQYVIRLSPMWQVRQLILFRDLADPDLWLGTDGRGRWGEMNGAHRTDLDGAYDVAMHCTPFTHTLPIRRIPLPVGGAVELSVLDIDVETLGVVVVDKTYQRLAQLRWAVTVAGSTTEFDVDEFGVVTDLDGQFRRIV